TNDMLIKRNEVKLLFDEDLRSGQEYNFFSRLLFITNHGCFIDKCLTKRRVHVNSIQQQLKINNKEKLNQLFISEWFLLNAVQDKLSKSLVRRSLKRLVRFSYETQK